MHILRKKTWSPFIVGSGIGLLTVMSYYLFGQFVGVSSAFVTLVGWIGSFINTEYINNSLYFSRMISGQKDLFQVMLIIGIFIGSFIATFLSNSFVKSQVPTIWQNKFGTSFIKRAIGAFLGGIIIMFGARLAGGCTSGKAISSGLQLLIPAWIFIATLFVTGIVTAFILYKK